jgi:hypothetical protein
MQAARDNLDNEIAVAKSTHASNITSLDQEAIETIQSIIAANHENQELTVFIPNLLKDWINITWDQTNRREKAGYRAPAKPAAPVHDPYANPYAPQG